MEPEKQGKHVLLVDDDLVLALMYQELLEANGYTVSTAAGGQEALKLLGAAPVDAIICDLSMPELSGDLFFREVATTYPQLRRRFVFLTANADNPLYENFLKTIGAPVVAKPATIDRLLDKLRPVFDAPAGAGQNTTRFFRAETPAGQPPNPPRW